MATGSEAPLNPMLPVIRELDLKNAPVRLETTSISLFRTVANVVWTGGGEDIYVGTLEALGGTGKPVLFTLRTDRISYIRRNWGPGNQKIQYKRLDGLVNGLIKHSILLKAAEKRQFELAILKKNVDSAEDMLLGRYGRAQRLITLNARHVVDYLLFERTSKELRELIDELRALHGHHEAAVEAYESKLGEKEDGRCEIDTT